MSDHQRWLEKPYEDEAKMDALYEKFCEENELEFDSEESHDRFAEFVEEMEAQRP
jgi:hypothetical protein